MKAKRVLLVVCLVFPPRRLRPFFLAGCEGLRQRESTTCRWVGSESGSRAPGGSCLAIVRFFFLLRVLPLRGTPKHEQRRRTNISIPTMPKNKTVGKYELGKVLGEGTFGKVQLGTHIDTGAKVAVKVLSKAKLQQQNMGSQIKKEISIMKLVNHPNVVNLVEVLASRSKIFIVLELVQGGELFDQIVEAGRFSEEKSRKYFFQLCSGVLYCHGQGVAHRDLKPENLLLDASGVLKISDFGLSAMNLAQSEELEGGMKELLHTTCGTPNYVAPEVLADKGYDGKAADTWSCGVILFVLLAGYLPFDEPTMSLLFKRIAKADFEFPSWIVGDAKDLISKLLTADPEKRITLQEATQHKWLAGVGGAELVAGEGGGASLKISPSEYDFNVAVQALSSTGESETYDDDVGQDASDVFEDITIFDIVANLTSCGLDRIFMSSDMKTKITRTKNFLTGKELLEIKKIIEQKFAAVAASRSMTVEIESAKKHFLVATFLGGRGAVKIAVSIQRLGDAPPMFYVEMKKGRGDLLSYVELLKVIVAQGGDEGGGLPGLAAMLAEDGKI